MKEEVPTFDVVQVGYGPVGQSNAALLGKLGHSMIVFERHASRSSLPRAGHIDHEVMRIFQSLGCADQVGFDAINPGEFRWVDKIGRTLAAFNLGETLGISGWQSDYNLFQPELENALDAVARRNENVEILLGWEAQKIDQFPEYVELTVQKTGQPTVTRQVRARYLIGADGGSSFVRGHAGFEFRDLGYSQEWLVLDFRLNRRDPNHRLMMHNCDPSRPYGIFPIGQRHRRFSFMVMPGEREELLRPEKAWELVQHHLSQQDADLIRQTIYLLQAGVADDWRRGRVLLMGDAAHVMPPFMGQGMCSGIRDAINLAWKLDLVLRGRCSEDFLDTYTSERKPHALGYIETSVAMGKICCITDERAAKERDDFFLRGNRPPPMTLPGLAAGLLQRDPSPRASAVVGQLGPQGRVAFKEREALCDDVVGTGWQLISCKDQETSLSTEALSFLEGLGATILSFDGREGHPVDVEKTYSAYFERTGLEAILVRPDFYVFGAIESDGDVDRLVRDLSMQLVHCQRP